MKLLMETHCKVPNLNKISRKTGK